MASTNVRIKILRTVILLVTRARNFYQITRRTWLEGVEGRGAEKDVAPREKKVTGELEETTQ
jgi:hypothetical protein